MADDITLNVGADGDTLAADDITGVKHQRVKMQYGEDGSATDVSGANPLPTDIVAVGSVVNSGNSTTTPLGGDAVFTGTAVDLLGYSTVCITLASDVDGAIDGMTFQFSTDNTNWDDIYTFTFDVSECPARRFQFPVTARYFRIVYTNGAGGQSSFRVQTILHTANQLTSIHRLNDDTSPDRSAQIVKAALIAQESGTGNFHTVAATVNGWLKVDVKGSVLPTDAATETTLAAASAKLPATLGQKTKAASLAVTLASDEDNVNVDIKSGSVGVTGTVEVVQDTAADLKMTEANSGDIKTAAEAIADAASGNEILIAGGATQTNDVKVTLDSETVEVVQDTAADLKCTATLAAGSDVVGKVKVTGDDGSYEMDVGLEGTTSNTDLFKGPIPLVECSNVTPNRGAHNGKLVPLSCDVLGRLYVNPANSFVSLSKVGSVTDGGNSTATPLGGDATFTGTGVDLLGYSTVCVTLSSNVDSAADGMTFQFSTDNSNWDDVYTYTFDVSECPARRFQFPVTARYFRVVYTNGAGAQGFFRVQTILHTANQLTSIHRLDDDINPDRSAQIVKSIVFAQAAGSGDYVAVQATGGGNFKVSVEEFDSGALGQATKANSLPVTLASDEDTVNVDLDSLKGVALSVDTGAADTGTQRVTIATDDTVTVDNTSIDGPGAPTIDSYGSEPVDLAAATADQELIAAPGANKQIWVYGMMVLAGAVATLLIHDEDATARTGTMPIAETGGFVKNPSGNFAMPWFKVATNKALEATTVGAGGTFDGDITYAIVSV